MPLKFCFSDWEENAMRRRLIGMTSLLVVLVGVSGIIASEAFAQSPVAQNRIAQPVMIGGLRVDAVYVTAPGGGIQSFTCPSPQQYVTPDGASQGWACFDATTNVWLLSAVPPQQQAAPPAPAPAPAPAPVLVQPVVVQPVIVQPVVQQPVYAYPYPVVQPAVVYAPPPVVQPTVIYAAPTVVQPTVVYAPPPVYPRPAVAIGVASINAAGRIASALIYNSRSPHYEINDVRIYESRGHRRY
jgi:hypothetical protein